MINILLADDHSIIRDGVKAFLRLKQDLNIVGEASNGSQILEALPESNVDLVLMDIEMPETNSLEMVNTIRKNFQTVRILILSMFDKFETISEFINAGVNGYLLKSAEQEELVHAIYSVANGGTYIGSEISLKLLKKLQQPASKKVNVYVKEHNLISRRELEVLKLLAEGNTTGEIADMLFTSKRTIESHRKNLLEKTKSKNVAMLIRYALTNGVIV